MKRKAAAAGSDIGRHRALWLMLLVLLVCFGLSLPTLNRHQISTDELASLSMLSAFEPVYHPALVVELVQKHTPDQVPLYYLAAWAWQNAVGFSVFPLRLLSTLAGMLLLAGVYRLGADVFDRRVALLAALLFSFSSLAVTRFHIIRMFPLVMLLAIAQTWFYWRLAHGRGGHVRDWLALVLSCGALFYTHLLAPVIMAGLGLYHQVFVARTRRWWRILVGWALGAACFLPYLPEILRGIEVVAGRERHAPLSPPEIITVLAGALTNFTPILLLPLILGIILALRRPHAGKLARFGFIAIGACVVFVALNGLVNFIEPKSMRYFLPAWPIAMILFAVALLHLPWRRLMLPLFVVFWAASGFHLLYGEPDPSYEYAYRVYSDFREKYPPLHRYAQALRGKTLEGEYLIGFRTSHYVYFDHPHVAGSFAEYYLRHEIGLDGIFLHATEGKYRLKRDAQGILEAHPSLIVAHDPRDELPNRSLALHYIEEVFAPCQVFVDESDLHIQRYTHPAMPCDHLSAGFVDYENGMRLFDRAVTIDPESDTISALLWWEIPDDSMLDDYNISLQVFAANGEKVAQVDRHLDAKLTPWGVTELATGDLPEGAYQLKLILYNRQDGVKVSGVDAATGESSKLLPLFDFEAAA